MPSLIPDNGAAIQQQCLLNGIKPPFTGISRMQAATPAHLRYGAMVMAPTIALNPVVVSSAAQPVIQNIQNLINKDGNSKNMVGVALSPKTY